MKKLIAILLTLVMVLSVAACGGKTEAPVATAENQKPAISGVQDASVEAGQVFDALAGVTASDEEDGDLTTMITVESTPTLDFKGGKATPENAGSYELVYSVTDKAGATAEAYATLTVTKKTGEATLLKEFDFTTAKATDAHGWEAVIDGAEATGALKNGAFVFDITNPGGGDGNVRFVKPGFAVKAGADYKIKVWAKSTAPTYAHFIAKNEAVEDWATFGSDVWNFRIDETMKPIEMNFTAPEAGSAELRLHLGKITPNPDNPADTTPENFTVTIDKVEIYEIVGQEVLEPLYTAEFAGSGAFVEAGDGAAASVAFEDGAAVVTIDSYQTEGGVWSLKANLELPGITIEQGTKYNYSFTIAVEHAQGGEVLVESATKYHEARANFNGLGLGEGEEKVISSQFVAEASVEDPVIRMQIGNASEGVTANKITVKNFVFNKVGGDKETKKTIEAFAPFGMYAENMDTEKYPWQTFNGTDEDNERGVGTIWTADGSLFYRIDDGGTVDWHNKLICPITLPADSYFIVEIKAKADKPVSCGFFLNPQGGWDPRVSEGMDFTTEEKTFTFETKDIFITDMPCELLFQFGSEATAALGGVTVEFTSVAIYQMPVL
ncbi:MAG: carbohydrate binding domain-containing protein [Clostridia bacterium]|nr:carbohydrate binding domain-containing protein [Clostridia bacterium]